MNVSMTRQSAWRPARHWAFPVGLSILALAVFAMPVTAGSGGQSALAAARPRRPACHDLDAANAAGYGARITDLQGITCIADPGGAGAMGVHYLNPSLLPELFDPTAAANVNAMTPELLVFGPGPDGQIRLVALEYLTIKASWDAQHAGPPSLFGRTFNDTWRGKPNSACRPTTACTPGSGNRTRPTSSHRGTRG